jgi:hypothetical protein
MSERKSRNIYNAIVANNTNVFDPEFYNQENIEWACLILDSRLIYIGYQAFLVPMLDFANYRENPVNPTKVLKPEFDKDNTEIKALYDIKKSEQVYVDLGSSNNDLLLHHGITLENNYHDCYLLTLGFTSIHEDPLKNERKKFFAKFFLYDSNEVDLM